MLWIGTAPAPAADLVWGTIHLESPLEADLDFHPGELRGNEFKKGDLEAIINVLLDDLSRAGFAFARVRVMGLDTAADSVHANLRLEPGTRAYLSDIVLSGARVTRTEVAWRLSGLKKGRPFTGIEGDVLRRRLRASGLFLAVDTVQLRPGAEPGALILEVPVTEPAYTRFAGILGVAGESSQVTGLVDLDLMNIAGTGREAKAGWMNQGSGLSRFHVSYREPWLPLVPVSLGGNLNHEVRENQYSFTEWLLTGGVQAGDDWEVTAGWGGARSVEVDTTRENSRESFVQGGLRLDRRNRSLNPDRGFTAYVQTRRGTKSVGDTTYHRTRWEFTGEGYVPAGARWLGALSASVRYLDTPERPVAVYDLIPVGGARSLRGYREEQFLTSLALVWQGELRRVLDEAGSAVYGFVDGGWLSTSAGGRSERLDRFLLGYGVGLRQSIPLGIIAVEYGIPRSRSLSAGRIHLRLAADF